MKAVVYDSSEHTFNINIPTTVEEFDTLAKKAGAALEAAVDHEVYHSTLGTIREKFCDLIEAETKIERREIGTGKFTEEDGKKVEVLKWETAGAYIARVAAEKNLDLAKKPFQKLADLLSFGGAQEVKFDPSATPRTPAGPKKLADKWKVLATEFIDKAINPATKKPREIANFNKAAQAKIGKSFTATGVKDADVQALGWLLKAFAEAQDPTAGM